MHKKDIFSGIFVLIFACLIGCSPSKTTTEPITPPVADGQITLSFTPAGSPVSNSVYLEEILINNDEITLAIKVKEGTDVYGAALWLTYDSSKINYVSASSTGSYLGNNLSFSAALKDVQEEGTLIIGNFKQGTIAGTSGDGLLLTVVLKAISAQTNTAIDFNATNSLLYNSQAEPNNKISGTTWLGGSLSYN